MKLSMPAAVLAGGASRRMGRPKGALPYGAGTLLDHQTRRLAEVFEDVFIVCKRSTDCGPAPARVVFDRTSETAAIHGLARALEEVTDRVFVVAVDLPVLAPSVVRAIAEESLRTDAAAVVPVAGGLLQPLAAVWRRRALEEAETRIASARFSLRELAGAVGAEVFPEERWRALDPSGRSFDNVNTVEEYLTVRERA